jgi:hypothetical protein
MTRCSQCGGELIAGQALEEMTLTTFSRAGQQTEVQFYCLLCLEDRVEA